MSIKTGSDAFSACYYSFRDAIYAILKPVPILGSVLMCSVLATLSFPICAIAGVANVFLGKNADYPLNMNGFGWIYFALKGHHLNTSRFNKKFRKHRSQAIANAISANDLISLVSLLENEGFWWEDYISDPDTQFNVETLFPAFISTEAFNIILNHYEGFRLRHPALPICSIPVEASSPFVTFTLLDEKEKAERLMKVGAPFSICRIKTENIRDYLKVAVQWHSEELLRLFIEEARNDREKLFTLIDATKEVSDSRQLVIQAFSNNTSLLERDVKLLTHLLSVGLLDEILEQITIPSIIEIVSCALAGRQMIEYRTFNRILNKLKPISSSDQLSLMSVINDEASRLENDPDRSPALYISLCNTLVSEASKAANGDFYMAQYLMSLDRLVLSDKPFIFYITLLRYDLICLSDKYTEQLFSTLLLVHPDRLSIYNHLKNQFVQTWPASFIIEALKVFFSANSSEVDSLKAIAVRLNSQINPADRVTIEASLFAHLLECVLAKQPVNLRLLPLMLDLRYKREDGLKCLVHTIILSDDIDLINTLAEICHDHDFNFSTSSKLTFMEIARCVPDDIERAMALVHFMHAADIRPTDEYIEGYISNLPGYPTSTAALSEFINKQIMRPSKEPGTYGQAVLAQFKGACPENSRKPSGTEPPKQTSKTHIIKT